MAYEFICIWTILVGFLTAFTAGAGLLGKLIERRPHPPPDWEIFTIFDPTLLSFIIFIPMYTWRFFALFKYWHWNEDKIITSFIVTGVYLCIFGIKIL